MGEQSSEPTLFGPVQDPLPGVPAARPPSRRRPNVDGPAQIPLLVAVRDELPDWPLRVNPDQLSFGARQGSIEEVEPAAVQLSMLPPPPIWEEEISPRRPAPSGRLARRRSKRGISPGQQSLFDD